MVAPGIPPAAPPRPVRLPTNHHRWDAIAFLHWPVEPAGVGALLPEGLDVHTFDGAAWVGVTPFRIRVRPPGVGATPPGWAFPETNVRTYVVGPGGRTGLWFLHMEVTARWFASGLRLIGLPYVDRDMAVRISEGAISYRSWPSRPGQTGGHDILVRPGAPLTPPSGGPFEQFATARWDAFHRRGPLLLRTPVEHPPWRLHHADAEVCRVDGLFAAAGLGPPAGPPLAHWSPGVAVRVGVPKLVR